jgi:hypothetical protein
VKPEQESDPYELAPETPAPARPPPRPAPPAPASSAHSPSTSDPAAPHPLSYRTSKTAGDAPRPLDYRAPQPADDTETIRNLYMPLGFLVAGLLIELGAAYLRSPTIRMAAVDLSLTLIVRTGVMMVAMLIAARFRQIELGLLPVVLLKLAAVAVGPSGLMLLVQPMLWLIPLWGGLIGLVLLFALFYALLGAFFDLDESDTWYCVMVMFIVWVAIYFGVMALAAYW